jgi:diacylglycerol kinase family enzyme
MTFAILLNRDGGTLKSMDADEFARHAQQVLARHGIKTKNFVVSGADLGKTLDQIIDNSDISTLIIGGGDGTVSLAASKLWRKDLALAVLPAGTMNLFARSIGMSLDLDEALLQIATGKKHQVDVVSANGQAFVHQFSIGLQPEVVRRRDQVAHRSRFGKMFAGLSTFLDIIVRPPVVRAELDADGRHVEQKASILCITNNLYGRGHIPYSDTPDHGKIGIYYVPNLTTREYLKLTSEFLLGGWEQNENITELSASHVKLKLKSGRRKINATLDGELITVDGDVEFEMHPSSLNVIRPVAA